MVSRKEFVVEARRGAVPELEFSVSGSEVRKPRRGLVQSTGTQVHGEPPHLARATEKRAPSHGGELLQSSFFAPFVLEPHLK